MRKHKEDHTVWKISDRDLKNHFDQAIISDLRRAKLEIGKLESYIHELEHKVKSLSNNKLLRDNNCLKGELVALAQKPESIESGATELRFRKKLKAMREERDEFRLEVIRLKTQDRATLKQPIE